MVRLLIMKRCTTHRSIPVNMFYPRRETDRRWISNLFFTKIIPTSRSHAKFLDSIFLRINDHVFSVKKITDFIKLEKGAETASISFSEKILPKTRHCRYHLSMLDKSLLGEALVRLRGHRSQRQVAQRANVPTGTWCQWEKGKRHPRESQIDKILEGLGCDLDELNMMLWQIQTERFRLRGSEVKIFTHQQHEGQSVLERAHEALGLDLDKAPPTARPALRRMAEIIKSFCLQVEPLLTEYEALVLALSREGPPPPGYR